MDHVRFRQKPLVYCYKVFVCPITLVLLQLLFYLQSIFWVLCGWYIINSRTNSCIHRLYYHDIYQLYYFYTATSKSKPFGFSLLTTGVFWYDIMKNIVYLTVFKGNTIHQLQCCAVCAAYWDVLRVVIGEVCCAMCRKCGVNQPANSATINVV